MKPKISAGQWVILVVAIALQLVAGFFFFASGLLAPLWAVVLLLVIWVGLTFWGYTIRHRPVVLVVPLVAALVWVLVIQGGSMIFGWTA